MLRHITFISIIVQLSRVTLVHTAKQHVQLSDSYLPVAMQVIAHLTDQMAYDISEEPTPKPETKPPKPVTKPPKVTYRPTLAPFKPTNKPQMDLTTPFHKPGLYAPFAPPRTDERPKSQFVLLPLENNSQYSVIEPPKRNAEEALLSIQDEEVKPLMEPSPEEAPLLPPHFDADKISSRADILNIDEELNDDSLQYLSHNVREMIKLANDATDDRVVNVWEGLKVGPELIQKNKMSSSNLRLLLLYDLLSREAKRQRLSDYAGFSPDVMKTLVDSSSGGAREQLKMALSKMLDRRDCEHEYANNRAREMVSELGRDESKLSSELRYLQPLVYVY